MMLMEKERTMLSSAGIGQELWVEAVETTCYLVNRSPTSALIDKTPQEVWNGKKPSIKQLEFVVVMLMHIFQRRKGASWITKLRSVSLLAIKMV